MVDLRTQLIQELSKYPQLDPRAVLSVASQEGLGGGIGDNGTSFGPFQLHFGGAYPSSGPQTPQAAQQWASSPAGIDYALNRINSVAGGLKGLSAISAIVSNFERPANPAHEIAGASSAYGGLPASVAPTVPASSGTGAGAPATPQGGDVLGSILQLLTPSPTPPTPQLNLQGQPPVPSVSDLIGSLFSQPQTTGQIAATQTPLSSTAQTPATPAPAAPTSNVGAALAKAFIGRMPSFSSALSPHAPLLAGTGSHG